jgi:hypothetical protein
MEELEITIIKSIIDEEDIKLLAMYIVKFFNALAYAESIPDPF